MDRDTAVGLIAALGLLALLFVVVRGLFTGLTGSARPLSAPEGLGRGVLGRTAASVLSFAVAYKFFFEGYAGRLYGYEAMLGMAAIALLAMTLFRWVETAVAVTALTVFLMENTAVFGRGALGAFVGLLVVYALFRWLLGR